MCDAVPSLCLEDAVAAASTAYAETPHARAAQDIAARNLTGYAAAQRVMYAYVPGGEPVPAPAWGGTGREAETCGGRGCAWQRRHESVTSKQEKNREN